MFIRNKLGIDKLPPEMVLLILVNLYREDLISLSFVSHFFNYIVKDIGLKPRLSVRTPIPIPTPITKRKISGSAPSAQAGHFILTDDLRYWREVFENVEKEGSEILNMIAEQNDRDLNNHVFRIIYYSHKFSIENKLVCGILCKVHLKMIQKILEADPGNLVSYLRRKPIYNGYSFLQLAIREHRFDIIKYYITNHPALVDDYSLLVGTAIYENNFDVLKFLCTEVDNQYTLLSEFSLLRFHFSSIYYALKQNDVHVQKTLEDKNYRDLILSESLIDQYNPFQFSHSILVMIKHQRNMPIYLASRFLQVCADFEAKPTMKSLFFTTKDCVAFLIGKIYKLFDTTYEKDFPSEMRIQIIKSFVQPYPYAINYFIEVAINTHNSKMFILIFEHFADIPIPAQKYFQQLTSSKSDVVSKNDMLHALLKANPHLIVDTPEETFLMSEIRKRILHTNLTVISCLISSQSPLQLRTPSSIDGRQAIHVAAEGGNFHIVMMLLSKDPTLVKEVDNNGFTPAFYAAKEGHKEIVIRLLRLSEPTAAKEAVQNQLLIYLAERTEDPNDYQRTPTLFANPRMIKIKAAKQLWITSLKPGPLNVEELKPHLKAFKEGDLRKIYIDLKRECMKPLLDDSKTKFVSKR